MQQFNQYLEGRIQDEIEMNLNRIKELSNQSKAEYEEGQPCPCCKGTGKVGAMYGGPSATNLNLRKLSRMTMNMIEELPDGEDKKKYLALMTWMGSK